jgi:hypothetical protein
MKSPKLPSFFKTAKHRQFDFKTRYYDARKEDLDNRVKRAEEGKSMIRFKNDWGPAKRSKANRKSNRIILLITIALMILCWLILKY